MPAELTSREIAAFGLGCLLAFACFNNGLAQARMVPSGSMEPTFQVGDRVLITPEHRTVHRGDVLVFHPPFHAMPGEEAAGWGGTLLTLGDDQTYLKRCIGVPGDTVAIKANVGVFVNGQKLDEPYILAEPRYDWGPQKVPPHKYFMLGDNRNNSFDSHYWGFLPDDNVTGRPAAVIWPPSRWRKL